MRLNDTSIYTTPLKFSEGSFPTPTPTPTPDAEVEPISTPEEEESGEIVEEGEILDNMERAYPTEIRRQWDIIESITNGVKGASSSETESGREDTVSENEESGERQDEGGGAVYEVPTYSGAVHYKVPKTGYYCVGKSPLFISLLRLLYSIHLYSISPLPSFG
jgi:hypothetical protein